MSAPLLKSPKIPLEVPLPMVAPATAMGGIVVTAEGLVSGAALIVATPAIVGGLVVVTLTGGSDGERYEVVVTAAQAAGPAMERRFAVAVVDPAWLMADGSAGWLSILEFVERFGLDETIRATTVSNDGLIDRAYLTGALRDAQAEVQLSLTGRYALPLTVVPDVIKMFVADLTAARLYHRQVPESVAAAASAARANLRRIADGSVSLPEVAGVAAAGSADADGPILWHAGVAVSDELPGYP